MTQTTTSYRIGWESPSGSPWGFTTIPDCRDMDEALAAFDECRADPASRVPLDAQITHVTPDHDDAPDHPSQRQLA